MACMAKGNPIMRLAGKSKKKRSKKPVRKSEENYICGTCGGVYGNYDELMKHIEMEENEDMQKEQTDLSKRERIKKAIDERVKLIKLEKAEEEEAFDEEAVEADEGVDLEEIKEMLAEVLAIVREGDEEEAAVEDEAEDEFPDVDEVEAAVKTIKAAQKSKKFSSQLSKLSAPKKVAKEEGKQFEGDENDDKKEGEHEGLEESPKKAHEEALSAEKSNYKGSAGKAKELPESALLDQIVKPNETIPSQTSVSRSTRKEIVGKPIDTSNAVNLEKSVSDESGSKVAEILKGKKAKEVLGFSNGGVFGW